MATVGQRFTTGQVCETSGIYTFDGYQNAPPNTPAPTSEERVIQLAKDKRFPPINSTDQGAYWKLTRTI